MRTPHFRRLSFLPLGLLFFNTAVACGDGETDLEPGEDASGGESSGGKGSGGKGSGGKGSGGKGSGGSKSGSGGSSSGGDGGSSNAAGGEGPDSGGTGGTDTGSGASGGDPSTGTGGEGANDSGGDDSTGTGGESSGGGGEDSTGAGGEGASGNGQGGTSSTGGADSGGDAGGEGGQPSEGPSFGDVYWADYKWAPACCRDFGAASKNEGIDNQWLPMTNVQTLVEYGQLVVVARGVMAEGSSSAEPFTLEIHESEFHGDTDYYGSAMTGAGTFYNGPLAAELTATVEDGYLRAHAESGALPLPGIFGEALWVQAREIELEASVGPGLPQGVSWGDGKLSGYATLDELRVSINAYVSEHCDCLDLSGPLFTEDSDWGPSCTGKGACGDTVCASYGDGCGFVPDLLKSLADIDTDGNGTYDATSFGMALQAVPATLVEPDACYGVDCSANVPCFTSECNPETGECDATPTPGESCDTGDPCMVGMCDEGGACVPQGELDCTKYDTSCATYSCVPEIGGCWPTTVEDEGAPCASPDLCALEAYCSSGECKPSGFVKCGVSGEPCKDLVCNSENGQCESEPAPSGLSCTDPENPCSPAMCDAGACTSQGPADCSYMNVQCAVGVCTKNGCEQQPAVGGACSDGDLCTVGDTCTADGCGAGSPYTCPEGAWACLGDGNCGCIASKNDSPDMAFYLSTHDSGSICAAETDYFSLWASAFNKITLTLTHASAQGDLGLSLVLSNGTTLTSNGTGDTETISFTPDFETQGKTSVEVFGSSPAVVNGYELTYLEDKSPPPK